MKQPITGYHLDSEGHWIAELRCGHHQHVRHDPPWIHREWVTTEAGRKEMLGFPLDCQQCDAAGSVSSGSRPRSPDGMATGP